MRKRRKLIIVILLLMIMSLTYSCHEEVDVDIYTTVYALNFITTEIVKDKATVQSVYPASAEVHDYEPSPKKLISISQADLVIYIGQGLEPFITSGINSTFKNTKCVEITSSSDIKLVTHDGSHAHTSDTIEGKEVSFDPHIWLDPDAMETITNIILSNLLSIPKYQKYTLEFTNNANDLITKFQELAKEYHDALDNVENKIIIVDHDAYAYWSFRYDITRKSLRGDNESSDPNSKEFIEIIDLAVTNQIKYLLATLNESQESLIEQFIDQVNLKDPTLNCEIVYLNNLEILYNENNKEDYFSIMRDNLSILKKALNIV